MSLKFKNKFFRKSPRCTNASIRLENYDNNTTTFKPKLTQQQSSYYTINKPTYETYEEIPSAPRTPNTTNRKDYYYSNPPIIVKEPKAFTNDDDETPTIFEDLSENLRFLETNECRKPPPVTRPPPPPLLQQPIPDESLDEIVDGSDCSATSFDPELNQYNCVVQMDPAKQLCNGRESGYGTNKSHLWGSPPSSGSSTSSAKQQQNISVFNGNW